MQKRFLSPTFLSVALLSAACFFDARAGELTKGKKAKSFGGLNALAEAPAVEAKPGREGGSKKPRKTELAKSEAAPSGLLNVESSEIADTVRSLNILIQKDSGSRELTRLLLNRAMATFSLARRRLIESKESKLDEVGKRYMKVALGDSDRVAKAPDQAVDLVSKALYIKGLVFVYLDLPAKARVEFEKSLQADPESENASWMNLFIAEEDFDNSEFKSAVSRYTRFLAKRPKQGADLAKYKLAWSYLNLKQTAKAKLLFQNLFREYGNEGFGRDAVKDLAFLEATYSTEEQILATADKAFQDDEQKKEFLAAALANFEAKNTVTMQSKIVDRLLSMEKDPVKRVQFLLSGMRTTRKGYASKEHFTAFEKIRDSLNQEKGDSRKIPEEFFSALDQEAQFLMRSFIETYSGRVKSPEDYKPEELSSALKELFAFYDSYLSASKSYPSVVQLWFDVCEESEDWSCVLAVSEKVLKIRKLEAQHVKAAYGQLVALEHLSKAGAKGGNDRLVKSLEFYAANFAGSENYLEVLGRLGEIYNQEKAYTKSIPIFDSLFEQSATTENLYRSLWARFEAGRYSEIVEDKRKLGTIEDKRIIDLRRESALKLAIQAKESGNFDVYKRELLNFIDHSESGEKAEIARADFYDFLIKQNLIGELADDLPKRAEELRCSGKLADRCAQAWKRAVEEGDFPVARKIYLDSHLRAETPKAEKLRAVLAKMLLRERLGAGDLRNLDAGDRDYTVSLLALTQPPVAISILAPKIPVTRAVELAQASLAIRLKQDDWKIYATSANRKVLGLRFPYDKAVGGAPPVAKLQEKIVVPEGKVSAAALSAASGKIVAQVAQMRTQLSRDVKGDFAAAAVLKAISRAAEVELAVANFIRGQDAPPGLSEADLKAYQSGVGELADSYEKFGQNWQALGDRFAQAHRKELNDSSPALAIDLAKFPWPKVWNDGALVPARKQVDEKNYAGALALIDFFRDGKLKKDRDYFAIRSGILLNSSRSTVMVRYVFDELKQAKQDAILGRLRAETQVSEKDLENEL